MLGEERPRDKDGLPHGKWETYLSKGYYVHGKKYGYFTEFYPSNGLIFKGCYYKNKRYGIYYIYSFFFNSNSFKIYHMDVDVHQTSNNKFIL